MTDFRNLFDIRIKNYFRHHNHIADLLSVILFDGHRDTHIRLIQYIPTEKSTALLTTNETIERTRDHLIHVMIDGRHSYVGIEHQSYNDQTMFQRIMEYDYLDYLQQYHDYQDSRGRDKIKKIAPDDDFTVSHEVACVLGTLTHDEEIYNHIEEQEGDVHMGQYVLNISKKARLEGIKEGKKEGREQGLHEGITYTLLQLLQSKLGQLSPKIIHQIQTSNDEQLHALTIHIFGINSEEDVLKILKND